LYNILYISIEILFHYQHGISVVDVFDGANNPEDGKKCAGAVFDVACQALYHLREARSMKSNMPRKAIPAFYSTVGTDVNFVFTLFDAYSFLFNRSHLECFLISLKNVISISIAHTFMLDVLKNYNFNC